MINCCYKCQERTAECHSTCERYKAEKEAYNQEIASRAKERGDIAELRSYIAANMKKRGRR